MKKYMGIDWNGKGQKATVTLLTKKAKSVDIKKFKLRSKDYNKQVDEIATLIRGHRPDHVVADHGFGQMLIQRLQAEFKEKVMSCYYSSNINGMTYNKDTSLLTVGKHSILGEMISWMWREFGSLSLIKSETDMHSINYAYIAYIVGAGKDAAQEALAA